MRVTLVTDRYAPEARAAAYLSRELAEGLVNLGHEVTVITRIPTQFIPEGLGSPPRRFETVAGVIVKRVSGLSASSSIWLRGLDQLAVTFKMSLALLAAPSPDILLVYSPPLVLSLVAVVQKWFRRVPYVVNLHDLYPLTAIDLGVLTNPVLIRLCMLLESVVYRNASKLAVAAPASRRILIAQKGVAADRVEVIFNYIDTKACAPGLVENSFRKQHRLEGRFVILYAGLMGLAQDLAPVIEVARRMQHDPSWVFVLAGDGPCGARWAAETREIANVKMVGPLTYGRYYEALQAADVCLVALSSRFQAPAVPGKVPAIMAAGRPMVAIVPMGNDTRDVLRDACAGISVQPDRPDDLLTALKTLHEQPELRQELGANGAGYAAVHFDVQTAVKRFESILREVHSGGSGQLVPSKDAASPEAH